MTQPTQYDPQTDFSTEESLNQSGRGTVRTAMVDAEFDAIATSLNQTIANLGLIQRDDGALQDLVTRLSSLSLEVRTLLALSTDSVIRGGWVTATDYAVKDLVTQGTGTYLAAVAHTAGVFATDLAAGKWLLIFDYVAFAASQISNTPAGGISAVNVQAALNEIDTEYRAAFTALIAASVGFTQAGSGSVARSVAAKLGDLISVTDKGSVADKTTDNTASILAACIAATTKMLFIPYGVKYDRAALLADATFPDDVVLFDMSGINDYTSAGESTKHFGIVSKDAAADDTHWSIDSGHHAVVTTNNFGTAGTTSATKRLASWLWAAGQYALGSADKRGFRGAGILQFRSEDANNWSWGMRSFAPWPAIDAEYELWSEGEVIAGAGVYRTNSAYHYVSTGAGTTGATPPTHTTGTVSDGGVSWTWAGYIDISVFQFRDDGRVLIGNGNYEGTFVHRVNHMDTNGDYSMFLAARGVSKSASLKLIPTDSSGNETDEPFLKALDGGLYVIKSDGSTALLTVTDTQGPVFHCQAASFVAVSSGSTTPDLSGRYVVYFTTASPVSITDITMTDGQLLECHFTNSNITFVNSSTLRLAGAANFNPGDGDVITFRRYPTSVSARIVEVSRSNN